ncbi:conserved Plasmodium protein, unknown function [Plasmodium gallinaceum]|uniref:FMR1-interacting protein 1 conserved domain-containing protein n=1 Tax=Plasmodium gallinaceum TaxID=5849 RepID=A0A1J1GQZ7_PLAGA|nr:conserved Plasmodium protein, unknown function [Plasmodium gallinaceum]CRG94936.1 conserved Plasmodium protein, unknown function [Plasmodium gallinaceum]
MNLKKNMNYTITKNYNELSNSQKEQKILYQNNNKIVLNESKTNDIKKEELDMKSEYVNIHDHFKGDKDALNISYNLNMEFNKNENNKVKYLNSQNNELLSNAYFENMFSPYTNKYFNDNNNYDYIINNNKINNNFRINYYNISNKSNNINYKKNKKYNNKVFYTNEKNAPFLKSDNLNKNKEQNNIQHKENILNSCFMNNFNKKKNNKRSENFVNYNTLKKFKSNSNLGDNNVNDNKNNSFNKCLKEYTCENKNYLNNGILMNHRIIEGNISHNISTNEYYFNNNNLNIVDDSNKQSYVNKNNNRNYGKIKKRHKSMNNFNEIMKIKKKNVNKDTNDNINNNNADNHTPKFIYCKYCDINIEENKLEEHNKNQHIKCPIDNCNDIYNIDCLEFHLLNHMKNDKDENILNNPKEIEKWVNERKKNYPTRKKIMNDKNNKIPKIKKKPSCLIEELLFERYYSAIGRNLYYKKELQKSLFIPLLTKLSQNSFHNIYENDYYNISNDNLKREKKKKKFSKKQMIDSLNIHKKPPLLYQLMKNEIYIYEKKLMKCIEYITENNFFDNTFDKKNDIIELK